MYNSFELLQGSVKNIKTVWGVYEVLSYIVTEVSGKVLRSQRDSDHRIGMFNLLVYYDVLGQRDEVKRKFDDFIRNQVVL